MRYTIDNAKCTGCGLCSRACFLGRIVPSGETARILEEKHCIECGHCYAICPAGAVRAAGTVTGSEDLCTETDLSYDQLVRLLVLRRSHREFEPESLSSEVLDKLLRAASFAPNGLNRRQVGFHVITNPDVIRRLSGQCVSSMRRIAGLGRNPFARTVLRTVAPRLYNELAALLPEIDVLVEAQAAGRDAVFYDAPCVIMVHSPTADVCGPENALYCAGNILLAAETLGLGSCVIGFATGPMKHDPRLRKLAGLPEGRVVHTTVVVGYPALSYARTAPVPEPAVTRID